MSWAMREPDQEIMWQVGFAPNPLNWVWLPRLERKAPEGWRGYWSFTWLFFFVARGWRFV
jgi:hypothetical protein